MSIESIDILWIDVPLVELFIRRLIRDEARHFTVADVLSHEIGRVGCRFGDSLSRSQFGWLQMEVNNEYREWHVAADISRASGHEPNLVCEEFRIWVDQDQNITFGGDFNPSLSVGLEQDTFCEFNFWRRFSFAFLVCPVFVVEKERVGLMTTSSADDENDGSVIYPDMAMSWSNRFGMEIAIVAANGNFRCKFIGD